MDFDIVDIALILIIASIVGYYAFLRYREEKDKKEKELIPTLKAYKEKFQKEKEEYRQKAEKFQKKIKIYKEKLELIKKSIPGYKWNEDEKQLLKRLKGTDFEWTFSQMFEIMGFKIYEPPVYKDHNIDFFLEVDKDKRICIDFVDYQQMKKVDEKYLNELRTGQEKYKCQGVWIITNTSVKQEIKRLILDMNINLFEYSQIIKFFPSIRIVEDYYETQTKLHNYELLHRETADEVIRRDTWIKEVEEKLKKAEEKRKVSL